MAVEKIDDGVYRVGSMTFSTADEAFAYDASQKRSEAPRPASRQASKAEGSQWSRMSTSSRIYAVAATALLVVIVWAFSKDSPPKAPSAPAAATTAAAPPAPSVVPAAPPVVRAPAPVAEASRPIVVTPTSKWNYESSEDKMTSKKSAQATIVSDNSFELDFPYRGTQNGTLIVRRHPQYGLDVIVSIEKGQMLCHTYDCKLSVRFDDAPPVRFGGTGPADHSSTAIFVEGPERFIAAAKKANRILIQFNAFHNGSQVLEFSSRVPLDWPPK